MLTRVRGKGVFRLVSVYLRLDVSQILYLKKATDMNFVRGKKEIGLFYELFLLVHFFLQLTVVECFH